MATETIPAVEQLKGLLHDQPQTPLRPNQITDYQAELARLGGVAAGLDMDGKPATGWMQGDRGAAGARRAQLRRYLAQHAPKEVRDGRRDQIARLCEQIETEVLRPALQPEPHVMRKAKGAVGRILQREWARPVKDATLTWRRARRALEPMNDDPDYTNIEQFRPTGVRPDGAATFDLSAERPGNFAMTPQAKANWPLGEPRVDTPLAQVQRRERAHGNGHGRKKAREKKPASPAQLAAIARANAAKAAKRAGGEAPVTVEG